MTTMVKRMPVRSACLWVGKILETPNLYPKNPSLNPKNPSPKNPNPNSGSNPRYPKLLRVIRVSDHGTQTTLKIAQLKYVLFIAAQPTKPLKPNPRQSHPNATHGRTQYPLQAAAAQDRPRHRPPPRPAPPRTRRGDAPTPPVSGGAVSATARR